MEDYQIVELIAQGGYGVVLKALQKSTGQMVAIKQFRDSDQYTQRIAEREISVLKLLHGHPNIIKMLNSFQHNQKVFLVFELMQKNLLDLMQEGLKENGTGKIDREQIRLIAVHRDIKPENLLLSRVAQQNTAIHQKRFRGHSVEIAQRDVTEKNEQTNELSTGDDQIYVLKVCDLGQTRTVNEKENNLTEYVSTRWYRAPELLVGTRNYDKSVDIWALGCIIPEMITGRPLFPGNSNLEALAFIIKTFGNGLTAEQVTRFYENPDFQAYGKIPVIRNIVPIDQRVTECSDQELDFIKKCLQIDPLLRPSASNLLGHPYLSCESYPILQNYENTIQEKSSTKSEKSNSNQNKSFVKDEELIIEESQIISEEQKQIQEIIEESENESSLKQNGSIAARFQTEQEEILNTGSINERDSDSDNNNISDSYKMIGNLNQLNKRKMKKRPSSSVPVSSSQQDSQGSNLNSNNLNKVISRESNMNSSNSNCNQDDAYGQENNIIPTDNNFSESNNANSNQIPEKQLPKPILFLRKQKEAREQPPLANDQKVSDQKAFFEGKPKLLAGSSGESNDLPFELAQDLILQNQQQTQNKAEIYQQVQNNRLSESNVIDQSKTFSITTNNVQKINREKIQFNNGQASNQKKEVGSNIGLLGSSQKQKRLSDQIFLNEKQQALENKGQIQQLYTIQKNKVLFSNIKNPGQVGRSPPVKLNNPKLLIQNMNQIQKNQNINQNQPFNANKFIDLKMNQPKQQQQLQQQYVRNVSVPVQPDDQQKLIQNSNPIPPYQQFNSRFQQYNEYQNVPNQGQTSKSPSQLSMHNNKQLQQEFLPSINKNTLNQQNNGTHKISLLNTQKHITNKLQLPSLMAGQVGQPVADSQSQAQLHPQQQQQVSYRKSTSIKSINNQPVQENKTTTPSRISTSHAYVIQQEKVNFTAKTIIGHNRVASRGSALNNIPSNQRSPMPLPYQPSQSHSPPCNNVPKQNLKTDKWYGSYNLSQNENKIQIIGGTNSQQQSPLISQNNDPYQQTYQYLNQTPKPMSRNSMTSKKLNIGSQGPNMPPNMTQYQGQNMPPKNSANKPPKR